jgi:hypothetical protein
VGDLTLGSEDHTRVCHVDSAVGTNRRTVEKLDPALRTHIGDGCAGALVERAGKIDVGYPEGVA